MRLVHAIFILALVLFDVRPSVVASGASNGASNGAPKPTPSGSPLTYGDAADVTDVASAAAFDALLAVDAPLLVHAYTPWSAACKTLRPTLVEAAAQLRGKVLFTVHMHHRVTTSIDDGIFGMQFLVVVDHKCACLKFLSLVCMFY